MEWNVSKLSSLRQCHRKFYFAYELSDHHFKHPVRRKAFELSQSKNLAMWQGSLIDNAFAKFIIPLYVNKQEPDFVALGEEIVAMAKQQFAFSESRLYHQPGMTKKKAGDAFAILDIHECGVKYSEVDVARVYSNIQDIINELPSMPSPEPEKTLHEYLSEANYLQPDIQYWRYDFNGVTLNPQIDMVRFKDKSVHVIDWKVSDSTTSDYSNQLYLGGIVAYHNIRKNFNEKGWTPPAQNAFSLFEFNLMNGNSKQHQFNRHTTAKALDYVFKFSGEQDILSSGKKWNELDMEDYETTDKKETCMFCKFKPLCIHLIKNKSVYDESLYNKLVQNQQLA